MNADQKKGGGGQNEWTGEAQATSPLLKRRPWQKKKTEGRESGRDARAPIKRRGFLRLVRSLR